MDLSLVRITHSRRVLKASFRSMVNENKLNPTIQSLRGIAILGVLAFHFQINGFKSGYLGVDVFFVISGYLITKKIWKIDSAQSYFTYLKSRAKRILPSYGIVLFVVTTLGWYLAGPSQLLGYLHEIKSAATFTSNYYYFGNTGYFESNSLYKPLLHFWSLAVEIQFYILFPILAAVILKKKINRFLAAFLIFYVLSIFLENKYGESFVFYDVNSRIWQFLAGSTLASNLSKKVNNSHSIYVLIGLATLPILIDFSNIVIAMTVVFIYGAEKNKIHFPHLQQIGNYSYEIYLWHWPIISFYSVSKGFPDSGMKIILLLTTLILAFLTQRITTRKKKQPKYSNLVYLPYGLVALVLLSNSVGVLENPRIIKEREVQKFLISNAKGDYPSNFSRCNLKKLYTDIESFCQESGNPDSDQEVVLWGDSTAESWAHAFEKSKFASQKILLFSIPACAPIVDSYRSDSSFGSEWCGTPKLQNTIFGYIRELQPEHLFLIARWSLYTDGLIEKGKVVEKKFYGAHDAPKNKESTLFRIRKSAEILESELGKTAISIFQDPWILDETPQEALNREGALVNLIISTNNYSGYSRRTRTEISDISSRLKWNLIDPTMNVCENKKCKVIENNRVIFADKVHVTLYGAEKLSSLLQ